MTYAQSIAEAIGTADAATVALVEDLMRINRTALDHLTAADFAIEARNARDDIEGLRAIGQLDDYCKAMGLAVPAPAPASTAADTLSIKGDPHIERDPARLFAALNWAHVKNPTDPNKIDQELVCQRCGAVICDAEDDDSLAVLGGTAYDHFAKYCPEGLPDDLAEDDAAAAVAAEEAANDLLVHLTNIYEGVFWESTTTCRVNGRDVDLAVDDFTPDRGPFCDAQDDGDGAACTLAPGHEDPIHVAGNGEHVVAIWSAPVPCAYCPTSIWLNLKDQTWRHDEHEGITCGSGAYDGDGEHHATPMASA